MRWDRHLEEMEELGYTLIRGLIDRETTAEIRDYMDQTIAAGHVKDPKRGSSQFHHRICHPMEGELTIRLAADPVVRDLVTQALRAENLRLRQQMFLLTQPCGEPPPSRAAGWHVDTTFLPDEWDDAPRKTFVQLFYYCNPVHPGGAATVVVPRSHHLTLKAAGEAQCRTEEDRWAFARSVVARSGVDLNDAVELCCEEGDVALFSPMLLHSGSNNTTDTPRYAFHCSFHDASAHRIRHLPAPVFYDTFPESMMLGMPEALRPMLER